MSIKQIKVTLLKLPLDERRQFAQWFYKHENEILDLRDDEVSPEVKAEIMRRRKEALANPKLLEPWGDTTERLRLIRMDKKSVDRMINRVHKNVAARLSSAR